MGYPLAIPKVYPRHIIQHLGDIQIIVLFREFGIFVHHKNFLKAWTLV